jgi:NAD(P)-dependent dehydrogenase (short-subunit alcohol dehydrogenase family)
MDEDFARRTPYGRTIVHGALTVIAALAAVPGDQLRTTGGLKVGFTRPVLADVTYRVSVPSGGAAPVVVREGDMTVLTIGLEPGKPFASVVQPVDQALPPVPDASAFSERAVGQQLSGDYALVSLADLRALADRLGATEVPDALLGALAWSSWFVGMRIPGRDALLSRLRLRAVATAYAEPDARYLATITSADPRTGAIVVAASCTGADAGLEAELYGFQRLPVPSPSRSSATSLLQASDRLAGSTVLVVGGSRGFGAGLVSVLAEQGATVWAAHRPTGSIEGLQHEFGPSRVRPLVFDAADETQVRSAFDELDAEGVRLDGVVLSAGPSVLSLTVHPDNVAAIRAFVDTSLAMALVPLAAAADRIVPGGWLTIVSSSVVEDMPEQWPHYALAKSAFECLGRYCAQRFKLKVLIVRPPKMWTDMSNGPLGWLTSVPVEQVASATVSWILDHPAADPVTVLDSRTLASWPRAS